MPTYAHIRWEAGLAGWELYGIDTSGAPSGVIDLLAWVYEIQRTGKWNAVVYDGNGFDSHQEFDSLEDAQAWCVAYVRTV